MKLSVIVPCYNFEKFIDTTILSIISQVTNFDYELIIIDDFSDDFSFEKIKMLSWLKRTNGVYGSNLQIYKNEKNLGVFETIKKLHELSSGEYIAFLDGDDYWVDNYKLQRQVEFLDNNPDFILCFDGYIKDEGSGDFTPNEEYRWLCNVFNQDILLTEDFLETNPVSTATKMYRKIDNIFKEEYKDVKFLDWVINFELSKHGKIKYVDTVSAVYRSYGHGLMSSLDEEQRILEKEKTKKIIFEEYNKWKNEHQ